MAVDCGQCGRTNGAVRQFCFSCGSYLSWAGGVVDQDVMSLAAVPPRQRQTPPRETEHRLALALNPPQVAVIPGSQETLFVAVANWGTTVEGVGLTVTGLPADWWTLDPPRLALMPSTEAKAALHIHPPRQPTSHAGEYPISVDASTQLDRKASAHARVTVLPFVDVRATAVAPESSAGRLWGSHRVDIENASNIRVTSAVEAHDQNESLRFRPTSSEVVLDPGATAQARFRVRAPGVHLIGAQKPPRRFAVRVSTQADAVADRPASFSQRPLLPRWVAVVAAAALVVGGLLLFGHHKNHLPAAATSAAAVAGPATKARAVPTSAPAAAATTTVAVQKMANAAIASPSTTAPASAVTTSSNGSAQLSGTGPPSASSSQTSAAGAQEYFAVVNSNGIIARSSQGTTSTHPSPGTYLVTFPSNVSNCAPVADPGYPGASEQFQFPAAVTAGPGPAPNTVLVNVVNPGNIAAQGETPANPMLQDNSFDLHVDCSAQPYVVVSAQGQVSASTAGVAVTPLGTGLYSVNFGKDLSACAPTATVDTAGSGASTDQAFLALGSDRQTITVSINDSTTTPVDAPFSLIATCQGGPFSVFPSSNGAGNTTAIPNAEQCALTASWLSTAPGSNPSNQGYVAVWTPDTKTGNVQTKNAQYNVATGSGVDLVATCATGLQR
jgi:hypothetical protein